MLDLLLASQNPGKLSEMRLLVEGLPSGSWGLATSGSTSRRTRRARRSSRTPRSRRWRARLSGLLTVADDSGLSVDALGGAPGLYSSRFGGEGASDLDRNLLLLEKLRGVPRERRGARFTSAVTAARAGEVLFQAQESVEGTIAEEMRGGNGFGYDPLFFYPPYGRTFGEVTRPEKDRVSHRGKAFARLRAFLASAGRPGSRSAGLGLEVAEGLLLELDEVLDALVGGRHELLHLGLGEGLSLGGALHLDEQAAARLDHVHVHVGRGVLLVVEVEEDRLSTLPTETAAT